MKFLSCFQGDRDRGREEEEAQAPLPSILNLPAFTYQSIADGANIRVLTVPPGQPTDPLAGELSDVALCHIRHSTQPVRLWIDQICINQKDNREKGQQVRLMSLIYRNAARVIIWLGPEDMYTQAAIKMINRLALVFEWLKNHGNFFGTTDTVPANALIRMTGRKMKANRLRRRTNKGRQALLHLLSLPWFSQVWVVQEAVSQPRRSLFGAPTFSLGKP